MHRLALVVTLAAVHLGAPRAARASKPIKKTLIGCVSNKVFFSISERAYPIGTPASLDLAPFEGKEIAMVGWLSPGDRFELEENTQPQVKRATCPAKSLRLIKHEAIVNLRVESTKAADAGDFTLAMSKIEEAMAVVTPPDCDTYTDRAYVFAKKGESKPAAKDLAIIKAKKKCVAKKRMNPLLLADVGKALVEAGDKPTAVIAYQLALRECDGSWCRADIQKALAAAKKK